LGASIGIALPDGASLPEVLMRRADEAMYQAKRHRHCYRLATCSRQLAQPSPMGAHELRQALQNDELFLVYQPIYDSLGGNRDQISGVEALVRWAHPIRGTLAPDSFLPLAERIGLLPTLGQRVLDLALRQLALWRRSDAVQLRMAVNLAPAQLVNPHLPAQIMAALRNNGVPADALTLEITENALMAHPERALESLRALRQIGVQVAIDDFGMGYSSFNYLKQYPFDVLKIDRSFTMALPTSTQDAAIVEAILSMSQRLNLSVIAEGVETEDQWIFLTDRGCQELQGFWLSRPLSGEALGQLLRNTPNH
jgi:EAL domain-containing protein (putative c-di-GMP-specific phosphodiesterase class I)